MSPIPRRQTLQAGATSLLFGLSGCLNAISQSPNTDEEDSHVQFSFVNDSEHNVTMSLSISDTDTEEVQVEEIHFIDGQEAYQDEFVIERGETAIWLGISGENVRGGSYEDTITIESEVSIETSFDGEIVEGNIENQ